MTPGKQYAGVSTGRYSAGQELEKWLSRATPVDDTGDRMQYAVLNHLHACGWCREHARVLNFCTVGRRLVRAVVQRFNQRVKVRMGRAMGGGV